MLSQIKWWILGIITLALFGRIFISFIPENEVVLKPDSAIKHDFSPFNIAWARGDEKEPPPRANAPEQAITLKPRVKITEKSVWEVLTKLIECESTGKREALNPDDKGSPSFGTLQFKKTTFHYFGEKYGLPHTDIMDRGQQIAIARMMILDGGITHWRNCAKKNNFL